MNVRVHERRQALIGRLGASSSEGRSLIEYVRLALAIVLDGKAAEFLVERVTWKFRRKISPLSRLPAVSAGGVEFCLELGHGSLK